MFSYVWLIKICAEITDTSLTQEKYVIIWYSRSMRGGEKCKNIWLMGLPSLFE